MRRFRHSPLASEGSQLRLTPEVAHHAIDVLRLRPGERVTLFDGLGSEAVAELQADGLVVQREPPRACHPPHALHLVLGALKGPAMDDAVRMATEAGATHLHPALAARTVATGDRLERWSRIATEAARQCGRADVPVVSAIGPLSAALARVAHLPDRRVASPGAEPSRPATGDAAIVVGPEGGLTPAELSLCIKLGFTPVSLGPWTLRAVTAAAIAVASLAAG